MPDTSRSNYRSYLTKQEIKALRKASDVRAYSMFVVNWGVIASCFFLIAWSPSIIVTLIALFLMAGRQLGIGILLHECSHRSFFSGAKVNHFMGHWFGGIPLLVPMDFYRPYHLSHHSKTGTALDPDVKNILQYPVTKASFLRKLFRDFSGLSGLKMLYGMLFFVLPSREGDAVSMGVNKDHQPSPVNVLKIAVKNFSHVVLFHSVFFSVFWILGSPELYVYWWVCYLFFYPFILRMRQVAEHAAMQKLSSSDVRETTRTTIASVWERALFAPNYVNYHCEHHYLPSVPSYRLKRLHEILFDRGFYDHHPSALISKGGYLTVAKIGAGA